MIEYKGYIGAVDFDPEINLFHGTVINTDDVITFYGASVNELRKEMQKSIKGYFEFCKEQGKIPEKPFADELTIQMNPETPDLRSTIAHILEHKQSLTGANEATTQQYVVLPILRALGWDDANLALMEVLPEYKVESRRADYALHVKRDQSPAVLIECKRWGQPIGKNEEQICFYAYSGSVPLAIITNGKLWRFYLSRWEASSLSDRIFCETDIENREKAISDLEKYLLKSNVASGEAEVDAEIALEEADASEPSSINPDSDFTDNIIDDQPEEGQTTVSSEFSGEWTVEQIRNLVPEEIRDYHETNFPEERCNVFYRRVAEIQNLIEAKDWRLKTRWNKKSCRFWLTNNGVTQVKSVFGIHLQYDPLTLHARIMKKDAEELKRQCGCEFYSVSKNRYADYIYYYIPDDITELRSILEFAYKKHSGN